jgi:hypothetical protein
MKLPKALRAIHLDESKQTFQPPTPKGRLGQQEVTLNSHFFTSKETTKHTKPKNDYFTTTNPLLPMGARH